MLLLLLLEEPPGLRLVGGVRDRLNWDALSGTLLPRRSLTEVRIGEERVSTFRSAICFISTERSARSSFTGTVT